MKGLKHLLVGLVLGTALGWALGFLRLPHLEKNVSFLLGFTAGMVFVSLVLLLLTAWKTRFGSGQTSQTATTATPSTSFQNILTGVVVLGSLVGALTVYQQNKALKRLIHSQDHKMQDMAAWVASVKQNDQKSLINSVLNDVFEVLKQHPGKPLNDSTIARLAALAFACKPHPYFEGDSLSAKVYSPERGQLLQALVLLQLDTGSFARIKRQSTLAGADLQGADLKGLDLSGINLKGAHLKNADLSGANLTGADLREANLWGANLNRANLDQADVRRADLSWAQLNEATLTSANLNGATFTNAQLRKAEAHGATFQWSQSDGALFQEANLTRVDFTGTNFTKANLSRANLDGADLRRVNLKEADLLDATLNKTLVDESWTEKLKGWHPTGVTNYTVVNDTADAKKQPLYRLKKR